MTYLLLSVPFILLSGLAGAGLTRARAARLPATERRGFLREHLRALLVTFAALAVLTAVFDSLMIASDLFTFGTEHLIGLYVGLAPVEDFLYPLMCVLLLPSLWRWLHR